MTSRRRQTGWTASIVAAAVLATTAWFVMNPGTADNARPAAAGLPPATAAIRRQTLVDTQTESGTLGYGATTVWSAKLTGTLTAVSPTGTTISRGQSLYRIDDTPVPLLYGSLPAYRPLSTGAEGADVKQFEQNLRALGYDGFTVDDNYTSATAEAVREWQADLGLPETGTVELGRVAYAPGPVRIDSLKASLAEDVHPGTAVLATTGTSRVVTVNLDVAQQELATKGACVRVKLPNGKVVNGTISKSQVVIDTGNDSAGTSADPTTKIEVTVAISDPATGFDQASVDVELTASSRKNVLTVPVAALLALAEGGYGVQVVDGAGTRIVPVRTGLFSGGRVEVAGSGLREGQTVGMPS